MKISEKVQSFGLVLMLNLIFIVLAVQITGCSEKINLGTFGTFFPIPPGVPTITGDDPYGPPPIPPVADIFWSNTISEQGYAQNRNFQLDPPAEFVQFYRAVTRLSVGANYRPRYWILRPNTHNFLNWTQVDVFNPENRAFWITRGTFENQEIGPLTMIYDGDLIERKNLTIVVTDLEEQGLNMSLLADLIRNKLLTTDDYAAAVIALKLPFNGLNYKPDPNRINNMTETRYNGLKPIYAIVSGPRDAVSLFISRFSEQSKQFNTVWHMVTTTQKSKIPSLAISDAGIPQRATRGELNRVVQSNKRVFSKTVRNPKRDLWNIRSGRGDYSAPERIWNLQNRTDSMIDHLGLVIDGELKHITERLGAFILQYKPEMTKRGKNGDMLWQLNINFDLPPNCDITELEAQIKNYRYLTKSEEETESLPVWQQNDVFITRDFDIGQPVFISDSSTVQVYVVPKDMEWGTLQSSVVCFDLIVRIKQEIEIPEWVNDFDDTNSGNDDKTLNFRIFVNNLLKGDSASGIVYSDDELIRIPILLFDIPVVTKNTTRSR